MSGDDKRTTLQTERSPFALPPIGGFLESLVHAVIASGDTENQASSCR